MLSGLRRCLGGVRVILFYPTPTLEVQWKFQLRLWKNHFLHRTPKLRILTRACWNSTISFETFIETENSCCAPRFQLIASSYKIVDSQTSFMLCWGVGVGNFGRLVPDILPLTSQPCMLQCTLPSTTDICTSTPFQRIVGSIVIHWFIYRFSWFVPISTGRLCQKKTTVNWLSPGSLELMSGKINSGSSANPHA